MEQKRQIEIGEKYLTVKILGSVQVSAFKNKTKQGNEPDYTGNGVAIWINEKKANTQRREDSL